MIALVVLWRLRYKLALRDLPEMSRFIEALFCVITLFPGGLFEKIIAFQGGRHIPPRFVHTAMLEPVVHSGDLLAPTTVMSM